MTLQHDKLLSLIYNIYDAFERRPHPNFYIHTYNIEFPDCKIIGIDDLFRKGTNFLEVISNYCINDLYEQTKLDGVTGVDDLINEFVGSDIDNFRQFYLTERELCFVFSSNGKFPHVWGYRDVKIPYSKLNDLLVDDTIISSLP